MGAQLIDPDGTLILTKSWGAVSDIGVSTGFGSACVEVTGEVPAVEIFLIAHCGKSECFHIVDAGGTLAALARLRKCGHQDSRKNGDDGDDDQQLDEREKLFSVHGEILLVQRLISCQTEYTRRYIIHIKKVFVNSKQKENDRIMPGVL